MSESELLFCEEFLQNHLMGCQRYMLDQIEDVDPKRLLAVTVNEWCEYFSREWRREPIKLGLNIHKGEPQDIRGQKDGVRINGTKYLFYVPYQGGHGYLKFQPSPPSLSPPRAIIMPGELLFEYPFFGNHTAQQVDANFQKDLGEIRRCLHYQGVELKKYNESLWAVIKEKVEKRREKLLSDQGISASINYPLRPRDGARPTYQVPLHPKKILMPVPPVHGVPALPDPELSLEIYEHILSIVNDMASFIEKSPRAIGAMGEEDIRWLFLIPL